MRELENYGRSKKTRLFWARDSTAMSFPDVQKLDSVSLPTGLLFPFVLQRGVVVTVYDLAHADLVPERFGH